MKFLNPVFFCVCSDRTLLTTVMTVEQALKAAEMEPKQGAKEDTEGVMLNFFHEEKSPEC